MYIIGEAVNERCYSVVAVDAAFAASCTAFQKLQVNSACIPSCVGAGGGQAQRERLPLLRASVLLNLAAMGMVRR
jgi:hypothetical protein